jgi:FkbM family methyltransferase
LCRPGDCVLDIGANVGDWTIAMAARVGPLGKVIAFEPVPYLAQTIVKTRASTATAGSRCSARTRRDRRDD